MRLQKIQTNLPVYLRQFYERPALKEQTYAEQLAALMENASSWADFWSVALARLGYETNEVISNAEPMQKQWARECGAAHTRDNWLFEITTAQVRAFRPDVLFVNDYTTFPASYLRHLKSQCSSIRLVIGWCGAPYKDPSVFKEFDLVLSSVPELVQDFLAKGHRCHLIHHAFEPRVLGRIDTTGEPEVDFSFVGSISKNKNFHHEREELLLRLIERTNLHIWAEVSQFSLSERVGVSARRLAFDAVRTASRLGIPKFILEATPVVRKITRWGARPSLPEPVDARIVRRAYPPLFGLEMYQQLQRSRISLNTHINLSSSYASNMRLYEATGVGSCLLTDWKANLPELFEPDAEIVTYRTADECVEKVNYLLEHEAERRSIARAGQQRTLRDHTFDKRAVRLNEIIRDALA